MLPPTAPAAEPGQKAEHAAAAYRQQACMSKADGEAQAASLKGELAGVQSRLTAADNALAAAQVGNTLAAAYRHATCIPCSITALLRLLYCLRR